MSVEDYLYSLKPNLRLNIQTINSVQNLTLFDNLFLIIQDLYIYCHLKDYNSTTDEEVEQRIAVIIMTILIAIFSFTVIKIFAIFLYFFFINITINFCKFCGTLIKKKCCINIFSEIKFSCIYLAKNLRKLYTYNFYSYENKAYGYFIVPVYLIFIIFNLMFAADYTQNDKDKKMKTESIKMLQFIAFELSIFIELVCCFFYLTRKLRKQFIFTLAAFCFLNLVIGLTLWYKLNFCDQDDENPRRVANLIFLFFYCFLFSLCFKKIFCYNLNCKIII